MEQLGKPAMAAGDRPRHSGGQYGLAMPCQELGQRNHIWLASMRGQAQPL